jgi:hypothetical protein
MLYEIYTAIKSHLNAADTEGIIKGIEWYNVQYESTIATTPRVFIEFPDPLVFSQFTKDARKTPVKVRLHVVTQAVTLADGAIDDSTAQAHEQVSEFVKEAIEGYAPITEINNVQTRHATSLHLTGWQHWHKYKGWMVTFVEFTANKII